ncbi:hypothetical protein EDC01DRAFT_638288 [Geopyxis carbonaria]|nr:hypothetical protein EDC01DRAFT_638288 [Geopyxis carbonaria]
MPESSDSPPRIPGDILQTPPDHSAYASSTEDHFSDAPEGPDDDDEMTNTTRSSADNPDTHTTETEAPEKLPSGATEQVPEDALPIPGSFGFDDEQDLNGEAASTPTNDEPHAKMEDKESLETPQVDNSTEPLPEPAVEATQVDSEEQLVDAPSTPPEVTVKWNEESDKIRRKVKGEKERIEHLVQQESSRSKSPSTSPVSAKKRVVSGGEKPVELEGPPAQPIFEDNKTAMATADANSEDSSPPTPISSTPMPEEPLEITEAEETEDNDNGGFGDDDFDDFGEAVDGEDFDDFEGFEEAEAAEPAEPAPQHIPQPIPQVAVPELPVPIIDFGDRDQFLDPLEVAIEKMFPSDDSEKRKLSSIEPRSFITERSLSLWNQLVAPPPLQPPNWKISRIRRLFLVSLGVPVDLDEILPAETKQKKLVLPSTSLPRKSTDSRPSSNRNSLSGSRSASKRRGEEKAQLQTEALDISSARILCSTSDVALSNLTVDELREHISKLEKITQTASEALTHWLAKRDGAIGDKETFETVIESLVGYARKKRQNG